MQTLESPPVADHPVRLLDVRRATLLDVWLTLTLEERQAAVLASLEADDELMHGWAVLEVADQRHFREKTVRAWNPGKLAEAAARLRPRRLDVTLTLLMRFHVRHRQPLLSTFLSGLGVRHDGGLIVEEVEIEPSAAEREAARLLESWSLRDVLVYLVTLRYQSSWLVPEWGHWLPELVDGRGVSETVAASEELEGPAAGDAEADPEDTHEFTTLDQQLVRVIVDVAQGVTGALEPDAVIDLVEELIELNRERHRSFFHLGFADVVLGREARMELPAQNESRFRWYWSGFVNGLAREGRWDEIVRLFDQEAAVRRLGESGRGPSSTAAELVFKALIRADRPGDRPERLTCGPRSRICSR